MKGEQEYLGIPEGKSLVIKVKSGLTSGERWNEMYRFRKRVRREVREMNLRLCTKCERNIIGISWNYVKASKTDPNICYPCNHQADYAQVLERAGEKRPR